MQCRRKLFENCLHIIYMVDWGLVASETYQLPFADVFCLIRGLTSFQLLFVERKHTPKAGTRFSENIFQPSILKLLMTYISALKFSRYVYYYQWKLKTVNHVKLDRFLPKSLLSRILFKHAPSYLIKTSSKEKLWHTTEVQFRSSIVSKWIFMIIYFS